MQQEGILFQSRHAFESLPGPVEVFMDSAPNLLWRLGHTGKMFWSKPEIVYLGRRIPHRILTRHDTRVGPCVSMRVCRAFVGHIVSNRLKGSLPTNIAGNAGAVPSQEHAQSNTIFLNRGTALCTPFQWNKILILRPAQCRLTRNLGL